MTVSSHPQLEDRGWRSLAAGRAIDALAFAEQIRARGDATSATLHLLAEAALQVGQAARAVSAARALVAQNDRLSWTWSLLARCALASGDPVVAAEAAMRSISLPNATAAIFGNAGTILSAAARHDLAFDAFERAGDLAPEDPRHRFNLAMEGRFLGDLTRAEADCDEVIARDPDHFEAWLQPHLDSGVLVPILQPWWQSFSGPYLYYPGRKHLPAPLRAFVDFIRDGAPGAGDDRREGD